MCVRWEYKNKFCTCEMDHVEFCVCVVETCIMCSVVYLLNKKII